MLAAQKKKEDAHAKTGGIPDWARAHPEALAKMQAAEAQQERTSDQAQVSSPVEGNHQNGTHEHSSTQISVAGETNGATQTTEHDNDVDMTTE